MFVTGLFIQIYSGLSQILFILKFVIAGTGGITTRRLKGPTQAKIIKKSVILFWLINMAIMM